MTINRECPMCGEIIQLELTSKQKNEYVNYLMEHPKRNIQDALFSFNAFEREFIKTGYCPECQNVLFGNPLPAPDMGRWHMFTGR